MARKTIIEHLAQAIVEGENWAPAAMVYMIREQSRNAVNDIYTKCPHMFRALQLAFDWSETAEGHEYWYKIYFELQSRDM